MSHLSKSFFIIISTILINSLFISCNNDEGIRKLKLSVTEETVYTDTLTYSFDIISGNGNYHVESKQKGENTENLVTINDKHVTIELISSSAYVTVTDEENYSKSFVIKSSHPYIQDGGYKVWVHYGIISEIDCVYGSGGYNIVNSSNNGCVQLILDKSNKIKIKPIKPGNEWFVLKDYRGFTFDMRIGVIQGCDIISEYTEYTATKGNTITLPVKYGAGKWTFIKKEESEESYPFTLIIPAGERNEVDVVQIKVWDKDTPMYYTIQDSQGTQANITFFPQ